MKLYQSRAWLHDRYVIQRKDIKQMAEEAGCSVSTIQNWLDKFELIKNSRSWSNGV